MFPVDVMGAKQNPEFWVENWSAMREVTAAGALGIDLVSIDDERIVLEFDITNAVRQPMGLLHGGVSALAAETAASMHSAYLADLTKVAPVGIDLNATHLSSARKGRVRVTGTLVRLASTHVFHQIDVLHVDKDRPLCTARVTNYLKPHG